MANNDWGHWEYPRWEIPGAAVLFGFFAGFVAYVTGWSLTVSVLTGTTVGVLLAAALSLQLCVVTRAKSGVTPGVPEGTTSWLGEFFKTYGRYNDIAPIVTVALLFVGLVWLALRVT